MDDGEPPFAVFAHVAGGDLSAMRGRRWPELLPILAGVADGLAALHDRGLVHRDLKPANVLLTDDGRPQLADFGLAATAGDAGATRGGSPFTMSPQQLDGAPPATPDDVYAFGALAYELLSGYPPLYPDARAERVRSVPTFDSVVFNTSSHITRKAKIICHGGRALFARDKSFNRIGLTVK